MGWEVFNPYSASGSDPSGEAVSVGRKSHAVRFNRAATQRSGIKKGQRVRLLVDRESQMIAVQADDHGAYTAVYAQSGSIMFSFRALMKTLPDSIPGSVYKLMEWEYEGRPAWGFSYRKAGDPLPVEEG